MHRRGLERCGGAVAIRQGDLDIGEARDARAGVVDQVCGRESLRVGGRRGHLDHFAIVCAAIRSGAQRCGPGHGS